MNEVQGADVATETQRRKIEVHESHFAREPDIANESILQRIDFGKRVLAGMEDRFVMVFD